MFDVIKKLANQDNSAPDDYEENGVRMCGKCRTPKQMWMDLPLPGGRTDRRLVPVACKCSQEQQEADAEKQATEQFSHWMKEQREKYGISDGYSSCTFARDDRRNTTISDTCRRYAERWDSMEADNMGVLFYGSVGTGKSYYACCIVNALLEKRIPAIVTNFPRLLNVLQGARERQAYIDHLQLFRLLVIDDLGVERDSSYAAETVYSVIDARGRSGLPLICTTNLSMDELKNPPSMQYARIYDRVLELCPITIKMTGTSRRAGNAEARRAKARELLGI